MSSLDQALEHAAWARQRGMDPAGVGLSIRVRGIATWEEAIAALTVAAALDFR